MNTISILDKNSLGFSCFKSGLEFAYGRLWAFAGSCTSLACKVFTAVFIGTENPPLQPKRRLPREIIYEDPKAKITNDSDDEFDIPDTPPAPFPIPRSSPIRIRSTSPIEEMLDRIEAKIEQLYKKGTTETLKEIEIIIGNLHLDERMKGASIISRIEELAIKFNKRMQNLKK